MKVEIEEAAPLSRHTRSAKYVRVLINIRLKVTNLWYQEETAAVASVLFIHGLLKQSLGFLV